MFGHVRPERLISRRVADREIELQDLREYFERILTEREKQRYEQVQRIEEKIGGLSVRLDDKVIELDRRHSASVLCMKEAVTKAEESQRAYNERTNEFRASLEDSNKRMLPKTEYDQRHGALEVNLKEQMQSLSSKMDQRFSSNDDKIEVLRGDIGKIREYQSTQDGIKIREAESKKDRGISVGNMVSIGTSMVACLLSLLALAAMIALRKP